MKDLELQQAIEQFEAPGSNRDDELRIARELRKAADDHADLLRRSRELGNDKHYR